MSYKCSIYINSGFNSNNVPENATLLNSVKHVEVDALDIMQERFLGTIKVRATWEQIKDADYLSLTDNTSKWYYSIEDIAMQASDVAQFSVLPDYLTTFGISSLKFLDGVTERVHVATDSYGAYLEDDPLLNAENPLQLVISKLGFDDGKQYNIFIESTLNPLVTQKNVGAAKYTYSITGEDPQSVIVPLARYNETVTNYQIGESIKSSINPGTCVYSIGTQAGLANDMLSAVAFLRSLGLEQSIIRQVALPISYCNFDQKTKSSAAAYGEGPQKGQAIQYPYIATLLSRIVTKAPESAEFNYVLYPDVKNNLINYSPLIKYGLISVSGEQAEFSPADLHAGTTDERPTVKTMADPHLDGKPYFRFLSVNGDRSDDGFWRNCIGGMNWKNVPLIYQRPSGENINKLRFLNEQAIQQIGYSYSSAAAISGMGSSLAGQIGNAAQNWQSASPYIDVGGSLDSASFGSRYDVGAIAGNVGSALNIANSFGQRYLSYSALRDINRAKRGSELTELMLSNETKAPSINFPFSSEIMRDFFGNDVYIYRYKYSGRDVSRIDKLLTMYGYRTTKPLEISDFRNREYFNYVMARNVTVGGHAKWINDGIADQLVAGVRVWHVLPNPSYYENNPIRGTSS